MRDNWTTSTIDNLVLKYLDFRGKTPLKLGMRWGGGNIRALSANNVEMGKVNFDKECYYGSEALYQIWMNKGDCEKGDVLLTMEAPLGNVAQIPDNEKYILSQRTILLKFNTSIVNKDFMYYQLASAAFQRELTRNSTGSTVTGIQQKRLAKLEISYPKEHFQQQKIAKILSSCDSVIEKTEQAIAKYHSIKQGMMHDLFIRGIDINTGKLRPKQEDVPQLYKNSELGWIPKDWEERRLEGIGVIHYGKDYKANPKGDTVPIIGTGGIMGWTSVSLNSGPAVLTGRKGTINKPIYIEGEFWNVDTIFCIKTNVDIDVQWFFHQLQSKDLLKLNEATGVPSVSSTALYNLKFATPDSLSGEQKAISQRFKVINEKIKSEQTTLSKYQQIKQGLMQDLLTGKVDVVIDEQVGE